MKKLLNLLKCVLILVSFFVSVPIGIILYKRKRIWLISEIDFDARDNGAIFFKYLRSFHKEINAVYIISKNNSNHQFIRTIGKVVEPFSYKHMLMFIGAETRVSTLVHGCSPSYYITKYFLTNHHFFGKNIALKHGIFKNVHRNYFKENAHLDLICCGTNSEFEFVNSNFHYDDGVAKLTGLARFDNLFKFDQTNEILIMPTWRRWLDHINDQTEFVKSDFYIKWIGFLKDSRLNDLLNKNNLKLSFFLHPKLSKFSACFKKDCPNLTFLNKNDDSIQETLKRTKLLITDYSSVFFDFAYMRKPTIYYQFDENAFYCDHYSKGYFDYRRDGFGDVCTDLESLIWSIDNVIKNNFVVEKKFGELIDKEFVYYDQNNCERIYCSIKEKLK